MPPSLLNYIEIFKRIIKSSRENVNGDRELDILMLHTLFPLAHRINGSLNQDGSLSILGHLIYLSGLNGRTHRSGIVMSAV